MANSVQLGVDAVLGLAITAGGYVLNAIRTNHKELADQISAIPSIYARRDDMKEAHQRIERAVKDANDKLDRLIERR